MHQPLTLSDEEGVRLRNGEIIHPLGLLDHQHALDHARRAIQPQHVHAHLEVLGRHPAFLRGEEGMLRRGVHALNVQCEVVRFALKSSTPPA